MLDQRVERELAARVQLDDRADALAEHRVGHGHGRRERHRRVRHHRRLHHGRADVLSAADDDVRGAPDHAQHARGVELGDVAREHPAVLGEELRVRVRIVPVARAHQRTAAARLAAPRGRDVAALAVEQAHRHLGDHEARGAQAHVARVAQRRARERAGLVRAVELEHARAGALLERRGARVGHCLATGEQHAQR